MFEREQDTRPSQERRYLLQRCTKPTLLDGTWLRQRARVLEMNRETLYNLKLQNMLYHELGDGVNKLTRPTQLCSVSPDLPPAKCARVTCNPALSIASRLSPSANIVKATQTFWPLPPMPAPAEDARFTLPTFKPLGGWNTIVRCRAPFRPTTMISRRSLSSPPAAIELLCNLGTSDASQYRSTAGATTEVFRCDNVVIGVQNAWQQVKPMNGPTTAATVVAATAEKFREQKGMSLSFFGAFEPGQILEVIYLYVILR